MLIYKPKDHHADKTPPHNARKLVFAGEVKCEFSNEQKFKIIFTAPHITELGA